MWQNTNASIIEAGLPNTVASRSEILKFNGVILLSTKMSLVIGLTYGQQELSLSMK
jgi:hypothetical protein